MQNIDLRGGTAFSHAWSLAIEDQFYLVLHFVLILLSRWRNMALIIPCLILSGGLILRGVLAHGHPAENGGVSFRGFQKWIYYPTWTRLDRLVLGVVLAAVEKFRAEWWRHLSNCAIWLWGPRIGHHQLRLAHW